jgi:hypothetical protein
MASQPHQQYFGHFSTSASYPPAASSEDDHHPHQQQAKLTSAGYFEDDDDDDNDDIVGSYLSDSQTFLKAWSSINNPFNPHNTTGESPPHSFCKTNVSTLVVYAPQGLFV